MTCMWVSSNTTELERIQIQPFSSYIDLAKYNLDNNTNAASVHAHNKGVAQTMTPFPLSDGGTPDAALH